MNGHPDRETEGPPDWSCGGYVYDDALGPQFTSVTYEGKVYPVMLPPPPFEPITENTPIATLRWLRPEECPVHGSERN